MKDFVIKTEGLSKEYSKINVVNNLSLEVPEKCIYGFLGPNGAGKTTTIRMLLSLIRPSQGDVEIFGLKLIKNRKDILSKIGSLVETPSLYGELSGVENLKVYTKLLNIDEKRISKVLELVGLSDTGKKKVRNYSLGMKQRLGIALALLNKPKILILDEPTNGLDPAGIIEIRELIKTLPQTEGITVFISSHLLSEIELIADYVGIINKGKLLFQGKLRDLLQHHSGTIEIRVDKPESAYAVLKEQGYDITLKDMIIFTKFISQSTTASINKLLVNEGYDVYNLHKNSQSLEEIFINVTQK